jgi:putative FmdB family regulatory protein
MLADTSFAANHLQTQPIPRTDGAMPIYEYECEACGHTLDALQKMSEAPLKDCPACGKPALRKRISAPRFRLKGAGWYETDFKQGNRRNIAEAGEGGEPKSSESSKKESSTTETKSSGTETKSSGESASSGTAKSTSSSSDG